MALSDQEQDIVFKDNEDFGPVVEGAGSAFHAPSAYDSSQSENDDIQDVVLDGPTVRLHQLHPDDNDGGGGEEYHFKADIETSPRGVGHVSPGGVGFADAEKGSRKKMYLCIGITVTVILAIILLIVYASKSSDSSSSSGDTEAEALYDTYQEELYSWYPELHLYEGIDTESAVRWGLPSEWNSGTRQAAMQKLHDKAAALNAKLENAATASGDFSTENHSPTTGVHFHNKQYIASLAWLTRHEMRKFNYNGGALNYNHLNSPHDEILNGLDLVPLLKPSDVFQYIALLVDAENFLQDVKDMFVNGATSEWTLPCFSAQLLSDQLAESVADIDGFPDSNFFIGRLADDDVMDFAFGLEDDPAALIAEARQLARDAVIDHVKPSLISLKEYLDGGYESACRSDADFGLHALQNGADFYLNEVIGYTSDETVTISSLYEMGIAEVARLKTEMEAIIATTDESAMSFVQFNDFLRNDNQFVFTDPVDLLDFCRAVIQRSEASLPQLFHLDSMYLCPIAVVADDNSDSISDPAAYYETPDELCKRPGRLFVNTYNISSRAWYMYTATTLREAVPGRHLQLSRSSANPQIPAFMKLQPWTAYEEGWALYAESLGFNMDTEDDGNPLGHGIYSRSVYSRYGALAGEMLRAVRVVMDIEINRDGTSRESARQYMTEHLPISMDEIEAEIDRFSVWPGQAIAYKFGQKTIEDLREQATTLFPAHDIRDFHSVVLSAGPLPMPLLTKQVEYWIQEKDASGTI